MGVLQARRGGRVMGGSAVCVGNAGIGLAHCIAELAHQRRVLLALGDFNARRDVNRPGPHLRDAIDHVGNVQPTRQNDRTGHAGGNERPIECLSTPTVTVDMGIEQDARRMGMRSREV